MKYLLIVITFFCFQFSFGQHNYQSLLSSTKNWHYVQSEQTSAYRSTVKYDVKGDTLINNTVYKKISTTFYKPTSTGKDSTSGKEVYLVENLNNKTVHVYNNGKNDLLYDFSLHIGDSVNLYDSATKGYSDYVVVDEDTISYPNSSIERIRLTLESGNNGRLHSRMTWVEGIGSSYDLLYSLPELEMFPSSIVCVHENQVELLSQHQDCIVTVLSIAKNELRDRIVISPNPSSDYIAIENISTNDFSIQLLSLNGEIIKSIKNQNYISVLEVPNGIYIIELKVEDQIARKKVMIQH